MSFLDRWFERWIPFITFLFSCMYFPEPALHLRFLLLTQIFVLHSSILMLAYLLARSNFHATDQEGQISGRCRTSYALKLHWCWALSVIVQHTQLTGLQIDRSSLKCKMLVIIMVSLQEYTATLFHSWPLAGN